jgi:hypothetical protein
MPYLYADGLLAAKTEAFGIIQQGEKTMKIRVFSTRASESLLSREK